VLVGKQMRHRVTEPQRRGDEGQREEGIAGVPSVSLCLCGASALELRAAAPAVAREGGMTKRAPATEAHESLLRVAAVLARRHREGDQDDHDDEEDEFHSHSQPLVFDSRTPQRSRSVSRHSSTRRVVPHPAFSVLLRGGS
jgi:hypothetical protein